MSSALRYNKLVKYKTVLLPPIKLFSRLQMQNSVYAFFMLKIIDSKFMDISVLKNTI